MAIGAKSAVRIKWIDGFDQSAINVPICPQHHYFSG